MRTRAISAKQLTMINPLQLLVFSQCTAVARGNHVIVDDW